MAARFTDEAWADRADKRPPSTSLNARGLGRPREQATARHTPGCARPRPAARTSDLPAHPGMREAGACRAHAPTVAHRKMREAEADRANQRPPGTPRGARPGPVVRTPQRWHTGRCARPGPTARTSDRPAHPGARGRGRPRGAPREGRARPGRCSWARCVNTTPEYAVRLVALGPRPRVGAPAPRRDSRQTSFHPDARERAFQKARYWPSACE